MQFCFMRSNVNQDWLTRLDVAIGMLDYAIAASDVTLVAQAQFGQEPQNNAICSDCIGHNAQTGL